MIDANEAELRAMDAASDAAGEFIEATGQTDMARWQPDTWQRFIAAVCGGYVESIIGQQVTVNAAAEKVRAA